MATRAGHSQSTRGGHALRPLLDDWTWQHDGRCLNLPSEVFFPDDAARRDRRAREERAKRICQSCPVIAECREHAVRTPEIYGIWGATTPRERARSIAAFHEGHRVGSVP